MVANRSSTGSGFPASLAVGILGVILLAPLHSSAKESLPAEQVEFFEDKIRPLLVEHCYECHDSQNGKMKGGLALNHPGGILAGGDTGPSLVAGDPEKSLIVEAVRYKNRDLQMPPKTPLPESAVKDLEKWVQMGAPDPRPEIEDHAKPLEGMSAEEGRKFWSFRAPQAPELPDSIEEEADVIDHFVSKKLNESDITAAPQADRETWMRRVTFDLTGLPPTPEEIDQFLADESPKAHEKVVDRLLASPDYGVRWGRHWLDVARYADSNGLDENLTFGNAWKYRDYVINAFNEDKPYDRFLIEQLAGDLIPAPSTDEIVATGFLALGARVLAEKDMEKLEMDVIDEQLDTTGKAFLGLTLGGARCHDHKFDPVSQADYYSMAAIFRNSVNFAESSTGAIHHWYEHDLASKKEKEEFKEIDNEIKEAKKAASSYKSKIEIRMRGEARALAVDYLTACFDFETQDTLETVRAIAKPLGLHPRILFHCRRHLEVNKDTDVFSHWWKYRAANDREGARKFYEDKFMRSTLAFEEQKKADPKKKELEDPELAPYHAALFEKTGFLAVPAKSAHAFTASELAEYDRLQEEARLLESNAPDYPAAMGIADREEIKNTLPIHIRGNHLNLGDHVPRAVPAVFHEKEVSFPEKTSGRLELAKWMASAEHPLTPRVLVNRVWGWHFGTGLVSTTENFGVLGDSPSHPELLDWLSSWFVENGWSIKKLNRLIVLSETYQRSSHPTSPDIASTDPDNRLLSHFPIQRLSAEAIRDSILVVSNRLDSEQGGKTVPLRNRQMVFNHTSKDHTTYESLRRTAYLPVIRNHVYDWLHIYDYPDPTMPTGNRPTTVVAPQALLMLNSPLSIESAAAFSSRIRREADGTTDRIQLAWRLAYGREPNRDEMESALSFINQSPEETEHWDLFCQTLFASNEFIYLR